MWISIISALVCFAIVVFLFTPSFRGIEFYRPLSFYFIFAGLWSVINFVVHNIWRDTDVMLWINYIGTILFAGYLLFALYEYHTKSSSSDKCEDDKGEVENENNKKDKGKIEDKGNKEDKDAGNDEDKNKEQES